MQSGATIGSMGPPLPAPLRRDVADTGFRGPLPWIHRGPPRSVPAQQVLLKGRVSMSMRMRWWVAPVLLAATSQAAAQSGDWTTYGGNDWNQRYSTLKTITTSNVSQLVPRMIFQTGITKLGSFENTPIVVERHDVRDHALQHAHRLRPRRPRSRSGGTSTSWAAPSPVAARTIAGWPSMAAPTCTWARWTPT